MPGKEKFLAKLIKGPGLIQTDLGNPLSAGGTGYRVCVYDDASDLVGELYVDVRRAGAACAGADCWKAIGGAPPEGKGYRYKDKSASADGMLLMNLKGGDEGKSSFTVKGKNDSTKGLTELSTGIASGLAGSPSATVQLFGTDIGQCFSVTMGNVKKNEEKFFKAVK